jgi:uncharacterized protein
MLNEQQGRTLIKLARQTIEEQLGMKSASPAAAGETADPKLQEQRAVFVTLHKRGQLRGCIGSLVGMESIVDGVRRHAVNAAFHDHRFNPVTKLEMAEITIDVSVLSEPVRLAYTDPGDLQQKLRPMVDGVILRDIFGASATFLPQVWEQLPSPELFLDHLCRKAGLPERSWRNQPLEIQTYQVQYFKEQPSSPF